MLEWYFDVNELLREMRKKAIKAQAFLQDERKLPRQVDS
jgi:hypothetical protein